MDEITVGCALRDHRTQGEPKLHGRIIHIDELHDLVVIVRIPGKNKKGHQKNYVQRPLHEHLSVLQKHVAAKNFSVVAFNTPTHWLLTSEQLRQNSTSGLQTTSRRDLKRWLVKRSKAYRLIRPFVHGRSIEEIVMDPAFSGWPAKRASELNLAGCSQIQRTLNAYLLALGLRNGLLPWYIHCGKPGEQKFSKTKTGRPSEFNTGEDPKLDGMNCNAEVRHIFAMGWKKYKKPGVSVRQAFLATLNEWFAKSIRWDGVTAKVTLKPEALKFTEEQFEYWGKNSDGEHVQSEMKKQGQITRAEMFTELAAKMASARHPSFEFIVVDEAQDVSVAQLKFLAAAGSTNGQLRSYSLFFAGDLGQRIFQQPFSWKSLGVDVRGRSRTLHINYRTSHQIRAQADMLLGPDVTDVDGNAESRKGTVSVFNGPAPTIYVAASESDECEKVSTWLKDLSQQGIAPPEIGIFVRSDKEIARAVRVARAAGLTYKILDEHVETKAGHASICTMHLAKGLEFRTVVVMACDDEIIPSQDRIESVADEADLEEVYNTERHLLYVACTRARDHLLVSAVGPGSEFLEDLRG